MSQRYSHDVAAAVGSYVLRALAAKAAEGSVEAISLLADARSLLDTGLVRNVEALHYVRSAERELERRAATRAGRLAARLQACARASMARGDVASARLFSRQAREALEGR